MSIYHVGTKWLSVRLQTKWLRVRVPLQSLKASLVWPNITFQRFRRIDLVQQPDLFYQKSWS